MGDATTGSVLAAALCFRLFLELKRGNRLFLMLGFLPSSMSVCGAQEEQAHTLNTRSSTPATPGSLRTYPTGTPATPGSLRTYHTCYPWFTEDLPHLVPLVH